MSGSYIGHADAERIQIDDGSVDGGALSLTSQAQGTIMYYNGTNWVVLAPGTSGDALKTQGAGANVVWGAVSSTGDFANGGDTAAANRTLGNNDNYSMGFETNAVTWLNINTNGIPLTTGGLGANSDTAGVSSTLSSGIDASVTAIPLAALDNFPTAGTVLVGTEEITYTGKSAATGAGNLTGGTRGANSTSAAAHLSAAAIGIVFTTPANYNAVSGGPVGVAAGAQITIGTDATWTIV
tara:strand:+ start:243 stop:959 length:717 start_codon:yes stop_codon:yes gene_type:complete